MSDFITLDPKDFSVEQLVASARGESEAVRPQFAVALLQAKLGLDAEPSLRSLATDDALDPRVRHAAALALAPFPAAREVLTALATSTDELVATAATQALERR